MGEAPLELWIDEMDEVRQVERESRGRGGRGHCRKKKRTRYVTAKTLTGLHMSLHQVFILLEMHLFVYISGNVLKERRSFSSTFFELMKLLLQIFLVHCIQKHHDIIKNLVFIYLY